MEVLDDPTIHRTKLQKIQVLPQIPKRNIYQLNKGTLRKIHEKFYGVSQGIRL